MSTYLIVALGGALGSVARFGISNFVAVRFAGAFPLATLIVNVTGSFAIGYFAATTTSESARTFWMVGICGGYTTFSAFTLQNLQLLQAGNYGIAAWNTIVSVVLCMAAVGGGFALGK